MIIYLHNPGHNGDILHTLEMTRILINSNPMYKFELVPACSSFLYNDLLCENVTVKQHPVIWDINMKNLITIKDHIISKLHNICWIHREGDIYINLWKLLTDCNNNCISVINRNEYIKKTLSEIKKQSNIIINFNLKDYTDLIPELPAVDVEPIITILKSYNKKIVLFYNLTSKSGFEFNIANNEIIDYLNKIYNETEYMLLLVKPENNKKYNNILNLEKDFNINVTIDGKNLIKYASIANRCDHVYFKITGGSQFILNKTNINNSQNVNYNFIGTQEFYNVITSEYKLKCNYISSLY